MRRRVFAHKIVLWAAVTALAPRVWSKSGNGLPNILILGDSISIGYTDFVGQALRGKANVYRPLKEDGGPWNCQGTTNGLKHLETWLKIQPKWDVIHFNFGLHDLKHVHPVTGKNSNDPSHPQQANLKQYRKNLKWIVKKLRATGAQLVFATTTPVPDAASGPLRHADQPPTYNQVAGKIMKKNDIPVNDLYGFILPRMGEIQKPNNVHFTQKGSQVLAEQIVNTLSHFLK